MSRKINSLEKDLGSFGDVSKFVKKNFRPERENKTVDLEMGLEVVPLGTLMGYSEGESFDAIYSSGDWKVIHRMNSEGEEELIQRVKNNLQGIKRGLYVELAKDSEIGHKYTINIYKSKNDASYVKDMLS